MSQFVGGRLGTTWHCVGIETESQIGTSSRYNIPATLPQAGIREEEEKILSFMSFCNPFQAVPVSATASEGKKSLAGWLALKIWKSESLMQRDLRARTT